jgi:CBS domain-containing protein
MARLARDIMTPDPACCGPNTTLDQVAQMMVRNDCGEIPVIDVNDRVVGVVTDRDIVCRIVAQGINPIAHTAESCMTRDVVCVHEDDALDDIVAKMERHQIRRVPVVGNSGSCIGIISQADLARRAPKYEVAELVSEVSRDTRQGAAL